MMTAATRTTTDKPELEKGQVWAINPDLSGGMVQFPVVILENNGETCKVIPIHQLRGSAGKDDLFCTADDGVVAEQMLACWACQDVKETDLVACLGTVSNATMNRAETIIYDRKEVDGRYTGTKIRYKEDSRCDYRREMMIQFKQMSC
jgi:hypothetical protein